MLQYTIRRLLLIIPTMFFVALITFGLTRAAPGSPFDRNENRPLPQATIDRLNRLYGIDRPVTEQFALFLGNALRFDFGSSLVKDRQVTDIIGQGLPVTAQLGVQALILSLAISLPLGVISALKQNSMVDYGSLFFATVGYTIPPFVIAIVLIFIFAVDLRLLPIVGWGDIKHMILPTVVLALGPAAFITRITRASMLEAIRQDYVRTARSKGLREQVVIVSHVMKNAMIPVATIIGPATAGLITGSFIIETLFSVPGIGRLYVLSINQSDYPVIMATTLLYAFFIMVANISVDIVYGILDPRIKLAH
ncbi:MAG TPA: peptide ABC transporter permease [Chloroflexi bacterium]|jgi:oligopeptide transport system permease protein|nr:peptide ABC transporter permease [Chloroflexota bacterium]HAL26554.1 peptide ABC transporter permease [Chloroflexota bacterium]